MKKYLLIALLLTACSGSSGHSFNMGKARELKTGVSTPADAKALIGEPVSEIINPKTGHLLLYWSYTTSTTFGSETQRLAISFDKTGHMIEVVEAGKSD